MTVFGGTIEPSLISQQSFKTAKRPWIISSINQYDIINNQTEKKKMKNLQ